MKEPRNEREASRLIQDEGFGRIGHGRVVDWAAPPPRRSSEWDDSGVKMLSVAIVCAVLVFLLAVCGLVYQFGM